MILEHGADRRHAHRRRRAAAATFLLWCAVGATSAWGYRPFVSTDAAVADPKEVEIEVGYFTLEREKDENAFIIPRVVVNYGLLKNWEAVAEFAVKRSPDAEVNVIDPALFVKGVLKEGALQDKEGFGIAVEAGPLLPSTEKGERRFGFEGIGIVSDKLGLSGDIWDAIGTLNQNFNSLGFVIIGVFLAAWALAYLIYCVKKLHIPDEIRRRLSEQFRRSQAPRILLVELSLNKVVPFPLSLYILSRQCLGCTN